MNLFASQMMKPVVLISEIDVKYYWRERQKDDRAIYVYVETYKQVTTGEQSAQQSNVPKPVGELVRSGNERSLVTEEILVNVKFESIRC